MLPVSDSDIDEDDGAVGSPFADGDDEDAGVDAAEEAGVDAGAEDEEDEVELLQAARAIAPATARTGRTSRRAGLSV